MTSSVNLLSADCITDGLRNGKLGQDSKVRSQSTTLLLKSAHWFNYQQLISLVTKIDTRRFWEYSSPKSVDEHLPDNSPTTTRLVQQQIVEKRQIFTLLEWSAQRLLFPLAPCRLERAVGLFESSSSLSGPCVCLSGRHRKTCSGSHALATNNTRRRAIIGDSSIAST